MHSQTDLAWAAGAIDGEGCIAISTAMSKNSALPQYRLYVAVANTDPRMPLKLAHMFGGAIVSKDAKNRRRAIYEWRVFSGKAAEILREVRPYLVIKGEQADVAIAFAETLKRVRKHTDEVQAARALMKTRIAVLKLEAM